MTFVHGKKWRGRDRYSRHYHKMSHDNSWWLSLLPNFTIFTHIPMGVAFSETSITWAPCKTNRHGHGTSFCWWEPAWTWFYSSGIKLSQGVPGVPTQCSRQSTHTMELRLRSVFFDNILKDDLWRIAYSGCIHLQVGKAGDICDNFLIKISVCRCPVWGAAGAVWEVFLEPREFWKLSFVTSSFTCSSYNVYCFCQASWKGKIGSY